MGNLNAATGVKDSTLDVSSNAPVSSTGSSASGQLGSNIQSGSGEDWNYGSEIPCNYHSLSDYFWERYFPETGI